MSDESAARPSFVRFVLLRTDSSSGKRQGILTAANELRRDGDLSGDEHRTLRLALEWFNDNVHSPECLESPEHRRALSWFKASAKAPIEQMWGLAAILREHGLHIEMLTTTDPGNVVYEDDLQVVARPRRRGAEPDLLTGPKRPPRDRRRGRGRR